MKKYIQIVILLIFVGSISLNAQSIKVFQGDSEKDGFVTQEELIAGGIVKNTTNETVKFKMKMEILEINPSHAVSICWFQCLDIVFTDFESPFTYELAAQQESNPGQFAVHLYPYRKIADNPVVYTDPSAGVTKVRVTFYKESDPTDKSEFDITFSVKDPSSVEDSEVLDFGISSIYPNPAIENAKIEFNYKKKEEYPHLEIYDLKGNSLFQYEICSCEDFIYLNTKEYANGSYYIQLVSGNKKSKAKVLSVSR